MTPTVSNYPQLSRPPLREAAIDIRLREELPSTFVETLRSLTLSGFTYIGEVKTGSFKLEIARGKPSQASVTSDEVQGVRFHSSDGSRVVQYRRNGITFSILRNYTTWEPFMEEARELWRQFLQISGVVVIGRVAVRYINLIEVPINADLDDYLTAPPLIPEPLPQLYNGFLQRVVIPFAEVEGYAIITQALEKPTEMRLPTVIDIDVVSDCFIGGVAPEVWEKLSRLRDIKNRIFFASVTAKALEAYR